MKISQETLKVLKNFSSINPNILFKEGDVVSTVSASKCIFSKCKIDESFPSEFAIYDLPRFLATLSLFSDPELEIKEKSMEIKEGKKKLNYTFTNPALVIAAPDKDFTVDSPKAEFEISAANLQELMKALSVLSVPSISIIGDGNNLSISAVDPKNTTGDVYTLKVGSTDQTFNIILGAENLQMLPRDYTVKIDQEENFCEFRSGDLVYWISAEV